MSSFTAPLATTTMPPALLKKYNIPIHEVGQYRAISVPYRYWIDNLHDEGPFILIPYMFVTDGASIPRYLWSIVGSPWTGNYPQAAVVHDKLFLNCGWCHHFCGHLSTRYSYDFALQLGPNEYIVHYTFDAVNRILFDASGVLGTPYYKRLVMYWGLKARGYVRWKECHWDMKKKGMHPLYVVNSRPELAYIKEKWLESIISPVELISPFLPLSENDDDDDILYEDE